MGVKQYRIEPLKSFFDFTVEGRGDFPFDMLRYDGCWPKSESKDVPALTPRGNWRKEKRQITLTGINEPTVERWESFGWKVL